MRKLFQPLTYGLLFCTLSLSVQADQRLDDKTTLSLLKQLVEKAILPTYRELDQQAQALKSDAQQFCSQPNENSLKKVRSLWSATLSGWQESSALLFGPSVENEVDFTIYFHPVKKAVVNGLLNKAKANPGTPLTATIISQVGIGGQGLAALEYLLFDREKNDSERVVLFGSITGKQRCHYLQAATELLAKNLHVIYQGWASDAGKYGEGFYTAGQDSTYFTEIYQPLELLVNRMHQAIQAVEIKKLGVPLGLRGSRSGKPRAYPYKLEAWRSGHSWQNIMSSLQGLQRLLDEGGILEALHNNNQAVLATQLNTQLNTLLETKLASDDLFQILEESPNSVKPFYKQVQTLATTLRTGLAPALGVQLGFNQNDGD